MDIATFWIPDAIQTSALALPGPCWGWIIYFAGLIILSRVFLKWRGKKVGRPSAEKAAYVFGVVWILASILMIVLASIELSA